MAIFHVEPIGTVSSSRSEPIDDGWDNETSSIVISDRFDESALAGLAEFSHVEVVYLFDRVAPEKVDVGTRRPRGNPDWPTVGIFAQRGKNRPNRIGVTTCRLAGVRAPCSRWSAWMRSTARRCSTSSPTSRSSAPGATCTNPTGLTS